MTPRGHNIRIITVFDMQPLLCSKCGKRIWVLNEARPYLCNEHFIELTAGEHLPKQEDNDGE